MTRCPRPVLSRLAHGLPTLALLLAACGGDTIAPPPAATPPASPAPVQNTTFDPALCTQQADAPYGQTVGLAGSNVMVASADVHASAAGCKVLARGGTAIDTAIAVQAVLGVTEPFGSGLGGGSVITYYDAATRAVRTFDGLSSAPAETGGVDTIYKATAQDVATEAPYNACKAGLVAGNSLSSQQGNTNISARAAGVPGTLAVLDTVHQLYGKTPWNALWDDAIDLARDGFPMSPYMYSTLYAEANELDDEGHPVAAGTAVPAWVNAAGTARGAARCKYPDIHARYCEPGDASQQKPRAIGTLLHNPELAASMALVRDGGAQAFYDPQGAIAPAIVAKLTHGQLPCTSILPSAGTAAAPSVAGTIARIPSLMTTADFAAYKAIERTPLSGTRFGLTIYTPPAPSFGGLVTLYNLGLMERKQIASTAFNSTAYLHWVTEGSRLANADRRTIVGDPADSNVDARVAALLSPAYLDARAALITDTALATVPAGSSADGIPAFAATRPANANAAPLASAGNATLAPRTLLLAQTGQPADHDEDWNTTSNIAIVDGYGNAISMTTTINTHWGSHIEAAGILINNALSNFSAGTPGLDVNGYAANKRPRSSIAPALAFDAEGRLKLVWGSAGGGPIPDYIVKTFLGHGVYGLDLQQAINADNFTGQNGSAQLEAGKPIASQVDPLIGQYGNTSANAEATALKSGISGIAVSHDAQGRPVYTGAADNRRNGAANGY
ncbi:MAG: gamma-glutamyltransferase [Comamonas sp.]